MSRLLFDKKWSYNLRLKYLYLTNHGLRLDYRNVSVIYQLDQMGTAQKVIANETTPDLVSDCRGTTCSEFFIPMIERYWNRPNDSNSTNSTGNATNSTNSTAQEQAKSDVDGKRRRLQF